MPYFVVEDLAQRGVGTDLVGLGKLVGDGVETAGHVMQQRALIRLGRRETIHAASAVWAATGHLWHLPNPYGASSPAICGSFGWFVGTKYGRGLFKIGLSAGKVLWRHRLDSRGTRPVYAEGGCLSGHACRYGIRAARRDRSQTSPVTAERRTRHRGRKRHPDRLVFQGILFMLHTGIAWEHLPQELGFGSGMTYWRRLADLAVNNCHLPASRLSGSGTDLRNLSTCGRDANAYPKRGELELIDPSTGANIQKGWRSTGAVAGPTHRHGRTHVVKTGPDLIEMNA
ncbi:protein of unknown function [Streptomyces murinus]